MKTLLELLGNLVFGVSTLLSILVVADQLARPEPEPHHFQGLYAAGLWTNQPIAVDPASQNLERVPGTTVADASPATARPGRQEQPPRAAREIASLDPSAGLESFHGDDFGAAAEAMPVVDLPPVQTIGWAGGTGAKRAGASTSMVEAIRSPAANLHVKVCMSRYRSYRVEDNTYQPFGGGPRKPCR